MRKFADALHGQLMWDLRDYGSFEVINIYEDGWGLYVHVMIGNQPYTVAYDINEAGRVPPFMLVCIKTGFYRNRKDLLMIERITHHDIVLLKERFHDEALRICQEAMNYGDFYHLHYLIEECGGYQTTKILINEVESPEFRHLTHIGRLDLTLENLVLDNSYTFLFGERERQICRQRLDSYRLQPLVADIGLRNVY